MKKPTEKIYCFVDETGQDTGGKLYIVVSVIVGSEKAAVEIFLNACETKSGRHKRKWQKTRNAERKRYVELALTAALLKKKIYYKKYLVSKNYVELTAKMIVDAIQGYMRQHKILNSTVSIVIDGMNAQERSITTRIIRKSLVRVRKIRGMRDQASPLIRLADTVAGMLRDAAEGSKEWQPVIAKLKREGVIDEV